MTSLESIQRRQNIRAAEGYLDLSMSLDDRWPLDLALKSMLADRAISCLDRVKQPLGHKPHVLFLKGQAHRTAGRFQQAIGLLQQAEKLDPDNVHIRLAIAWCYKRTDRLADAIISMQAAVESDSECPIAHYNLACYCALAAQVDLALMHLSFAIDLRPEFRESLETETDFDSIRENPRFASLLTANV